MFPSKGASPLGSPGSRFLYAVGLVLVGVVCVGRSPEKIYLRYLLVPNDTEFSINFNLLLGSHSVLN